MTWQAKALAGQQINCADVVSAYGAVLERGFDGAGNTAPESSLPFDKALIKAAIIETAASAETSPQLVENLCAAFMSLAHYRPGEIGERVYLKDLGNGVQIDNLHRRTTNLSEETAFSELEREAFFAGVVESEGEALGKEWTRRMKFSRGMNNA